MFPRDGSRPRWRSGERFAAGSDRGVVGLANERFGYEGVARSDGRAPDPTVVFARIQRTDLTGSVGVEQSWVERLQRTRVSGSASTGWTRVARRGSRDRRRQRVAHRHGVSRCKHGQAEALARARARSTARYTVARPTPNSSASSPIVCSPASCRATRCAS
jgi:hypothetical protein